MFKKAVILFALVFALALPSAGAEDAPMLDIQLQLGEQTVKINGESTSVEAPYRSGDTTLVPLRVVTTAFGATLQWDGTTQTIVLKYGIKQLKLVIGSTQAEVDGVVKELPAAPELKNETTMVPIRFISENFGATVSFDDATSTIGIKGTKQAANGGINVAIDSDTGKTKIGNSYYGWTMQYPSGLIKDKQNYRESSTLFKDAKDEFSLIVSVDEDQDTMTKDGLLKYLASDIEDTILEKRYVENGKNSYALVIAKKDKNITEYRAIQNGERIYLLVFITKEELYSNKDKVKVYKELLDSFTTSYNKTDLTVKDLSTVKDGNRPYDSAEFGVSLSLPATWNMDQSNEWLVFYDKDDSEGFSIRLTSIVDGDTLDAWLDREVKYYQDEYVREFIKWTPPTDLKVGGEPAKLLKYSTTFSEKWQHVYGYYAFKEKYKYEMNFWSTKSSVSEDVVEKIVSSIKFTKLPSTRGYIQDDRDFIDRTQMSTMSNKKYKFSISIPDYWTTLDLEKDTQIGYSSNSGAVVISVFEDVSLEQAKKSVELIMKNRESTVTDFRSIPPVTVSMSGTIAYKYTYSGTRSDGGSYSGSSYVISKGNKVYIIDDTLFKAGTTDANKKMHEAIVNSFKVIE